MDEAEAQYNPWMESLSTFSHGGPIRSGSTVEIDARSRPAVRVDGAPPGATLVVNNIGTQVPEYSVLVGDNPQPDSATPSAPATIVLRAAPTLRQLSIRPIRGELREVVLDLAGTESPVSIVGEGHGGKLAVTGGTADIGIPPLSELQVTDATAVSSSGVIREAERLVLSGNTGVRTIRAAQTEIKAGSVLALGGTSVEFGDVSVVGEGTCTFQGGTAVVRRFQDGASVELLDGTLNIGQGLAPTDPPISGLVLVGTGQIYVLHKLSEPTFDGALLLDLHDAAEVTDASGNVGLIARHRSLCTGNPKQPLVLTAVHAAEGAEVQVVSAFDLLPSDLRALEKIERFVPAFPRARELRREVDHMQMGTTDPAVQSRRRAHFWSRMVTLLASSHASGGIQSDARYVAARARRHHLTWNRDFREKTLLTAYAFVGYGERVLWPLGWLLVMSVVGAIALWDRSSDLCCERSGEFLGAILSLFLSPLEFFRFTEAPEASGPLEESVVLLIRIIGLVLLFFSLSAARRVAKAE